MNSSRRAFSLSGIAILGAAGAVSTLTRDARAQVPANLDACVKAFLDQRRITWSQGVNYWNVRYEDGQALCELVQFLHTDSHPDTADIHLRSQSCAPVGVNPAVTAWARPWDTSVDERLKYRLP